MKLDRLFGILTLLLQKDSVTAPELARRFEVTRRTIGRDIDALCRAGIPVVTRQGGGGGISLAPGYKLDKTLLTADELSGLLAGLKGLGTVEEQSQVERTLSKLALGRDALISLDLPIVIDLSAHHKGSLVQKIDLLKTAIRDRRVVAFDYYYEKGMSPRQVEPAFALFQWADWYLVGYCLDRQDFRMFKLNRLWEARLCEQTFLPRPVPDSFRNLNDRFANDKQLTALFHPSVEYLLVEAYGPGSFQREPDGMLRLMIDYTNRSYMLSWLFGFGDKVKVLSPPDLAQEHRETAQKIAKQYE